jgi:catechol 2,3-dioxygenase-like lactoylglutathione lyase family enzyme
MAIRLRYVPLRCHDLERSRSFYRDVLGLTETTVRRHEFAQLEVGGAELCVDLEHGDQPTPAAIFAVDDLAGLRSQIETAGHAVRDQGDTWIQVADPDGNLLVFENA